MQFGFDPFYDYVDVIFPVIAGITKVVKYKKVILVLVLLSGLLGFICVILS